MDPTRKAQENRQALIARERRVAREVMRQYGLTLQRVEQQLSQVRAAIRQAQARGDVIDAAWVAREQRVQDFLDGTRRELQAYAEQVAPLIADLQREQAQAGLQDTTALTKAVTPAAVQGTVAFGVPPARTVSQIVGNAMDGTPLGDLLHEVAGQGFTEARDALVQGVIGGHNPRKIARALRDATGQTLQRSLLIARTESIRAYRQTSLDMMRANSHVLQGWVWQCAYDRRTCAACWAMSGQTFPLTENMDSHPGCRCTAVPQSVSWADLGFQGIPDVAAPEQGAAVFARQPQSVQREILGPGKYQAYQQGHIGLQDLVEHTHSDRWGPGLREASLDRAMAAHA